ncbi:MAG: ABC transporter ATP-binding protein [Pseudomonadota bacterium]
MKGLGGMSKLKVEPVKHPDRIINYWKKEKTVVALIVVFGLAFNISMVLGPIYQGRLIDSIVYGASLPKVVSQAAVFIVLIGGIQLLRYFKRFYIRRFANSTSASMRLMIYNNIMNKSASGLGRENVGNLMTRAVSDVDLCVEGMRKFTTEVFDTGVVMASYIAAMLAYDVRITLLSCIFIPAAMMLAEKLKTVIYRYSTAYRTKSGEVAGITYDLVENALMYRANGMESMNSRNYDTELKALQDIAVKAHILENSMQPVYNSIAMLGSAIVIYLGGIKAINGQWIAGIFIAYITMYAAMATKASKAAKLFNSVQKSQVSWKRIKPYLTEYSRKDSPLAGCKAGTELLVKGLGFSYSENGENIIENICFEARTGEIIGVTGSIATGKSSLGLSILGLYPYTGSIRIDGKELGEYTDNERSGMIAYLGHKPQLLSDTIYNNITLGCDKDITEVLVDVCFEEDLASMPEGWNTLVGNNGVRLSGGQQARIALARALLNKNKIIILDDPFSAVDMKTEERIMDNLRKNYRDSIIVLISHRLSVFRSIDRIILLKNDKTFECGTHEELMRSSRLYETIFELQCAESGDGYEK